jgi:hypothetical protein
MPQNRTIGILLVIGLLCGVAVVPKATAGQRRTYAGRPLAEVLAELQTGQFQIIFSSSLVPLTLRVVAEPTGTARDDIAREVLAPHGLTLKRGPQNRYVVVRLEPPSPVAREQSSPTDAPLSRPGPPAAAAAVPMHVEERVEVIERLHEARTHAATYVVDDTALHETAGALDVLHALRNVPAAAATNDEDGTYAVRGLGPEHNLIVLDGIQIHHPRRFGEYSSSFVSPLTTRSVRLDASSLDAHYGGRLSSVTVIETRDGDRTQPLAFTGSLGLTSGDALIEGRLANTESGSWWIGGRGTYYGPFVNRLTSDAVPGFGDVQFKITARPTTRTRLSVFGLGGRETASDRDRVSDIQEPGGGSGGSAVVPGAEYVGSNAIGLVNFTWTPHERLVATSTVSGYRHDAQDHDASLVFAGVPPFDRHVRVNDVTVRQAVAFAPRGRHLLEAGTEVHRIQSRWRMSGAQRAEFARGLGPSIWGEFVDDSNGGIDTTLSRTHAGAWLQHRMSLGARFGVEPGVRLDWNSFTGEAAWQPRVRATATVGSAVIWTGVSMQAQTPSHETLQGFDYFHLTPAIGPQLHNERSRQVVAGFDYALVAGAHVRVEAYHRRLDRLLVTQLETDAERARRLARYDIPSDLPADSVILERRPVMHPESTGRGVVRGLELQLVRRGERVDGTFAYALSKSTRETHGSTFPFDFDRRHALHGSLVVDMTRRIRAGATWQRASGFPMTPVQEEVWFFNRILPGGEIDPIARPVRDIDGSLATAPSPGMRRLANRNSGRLNGYARTDVRVTYSTLGRWEFYGEVLNVFDRHNHQEEIESAAGSAISQYSTYNYFRRLPSFGVRVHF